MGTRGNAGRDPQGHARGHEQHETTVRTGTVEGRESIHSPPITGASNFPLTVGSLPGRLDPVPGRVTSGVLLLQPHGLFRPQDLAVYRPAEDCRLD